MLAIDYEKLREDVILGVQFLLVVFVAGGVIGITAYIEATVGIPDLVDWWPVVFFGLLGLSLLKDRYTVDENAGKGDTAGS